MQIDLSDKVILVTGASRGIGRAIALRAGAAGATVAVHYASRRIDAEAVTQEIPGGRHFQADLSDVDACNDLMKEVVAAFGRVDVLVNNAAVAMAVDLEADDTEWHHVWDFTLNLNLRAPELLSRLALRHFLNQAGTPGHFRIINITSRAAFRGDAPEYAAYAASKGGLVALTRTIARGYGNRGVRAFTIAPGFTRTEMAEDFIARFGDHVVGDIALERVTEPEDIAPLVVLFASGMADHATGCTVDVNAGSYVH